ncbi:MAG: VPDSG-CTERM sorting domain-containing protein [Verrucomicrobiota bacterium]|nr:VPDSG-CTERM sorting domain-containing protein [Verrucomicrobiota bacterium]
MKSKIPKANRRGKALKMALKFTGLCLAAAVFALLLETRVSAVSFNLGTAGLGSPYNWAVLSIGDASTVDIDNTSITGGSGVNGNFGLSSKNSLTMSGSSFIDGTLYQGNTATYSLSGSASISSVLPSQDTVLNQATSDALAAAANAAGLGGTPGSITSAGLNSFTPGVYSLSSLSLSSGGELQLNGAGTYIFNISGSMSLSGSALVSLINGANAANVLFNITGTSPVSMTGDSVVRGIILAPNADITIDGGLSDTPPVGLFGEAIGGENITIQSGSQVQGLPNVPDGGATAILLGLACGAVAFARRKLRV